MGSAEPSVSFRSILLVWAALMALWALSYVASKVGLGWAGTYVALGIAAAKAFLVAAWFMDLRVERFTSRAVPVVAVAWVILLAGLMATDILTRDVPPLRPPPASLD